MSKAASTHLPLCHRNPALHQQGYLASTVWTASNLKQLVWRKNHTNPNNMKQCLVSFFVGKILQHLYIILWSHFSFLLYSRKGFVIEASLFLCSKHIKFSVSVYKMKWQKLVKFYEAFQAHPSFYGEVLHNSVEKSVNAFAVKHLKQCSKNSPKQGETLQDVSCPTF